MVEEHGANILNDIRKGRYEIVADDMERNPTAKHLRFMQKSEVVQTVLSMFGNVGIPPQAISLILQWWLGESDLGDVNEFIQAFTQVVQEGQAEQTDQMQRQQAMQEVGSLLELAGKKQGLESPEFTQKAVA